MKNLKNMEVQFLAPITIFGSAASLTFINLTNANTFPKSLLQNQFVGETFQYLWNIVFCFFAFSCLLQFFSVCRLNASKKFTTLDLYFVSVATAFILLEALSFWTIIHADGNSYHYNYLNTLEIIQHCFTLSYLTWTVLWSHHIRKGWNPSQNWVICLVLSISVHSMLVHTNSFYFLLAIASTLSVVSIHKFYKIHYYRTRVRFLHNLLISLHILFFTFHLLDYYLSDSLHFPMSRVCTLLFLFIANSSNQLFIRVLIEVNEYKLF